jgi:hypothetical protein
MRGEAVACERSERYCREVFVLDTPRSVVLSARDGIIITGRLSIYRSSLFDNPSIIERTQVA